MQTVLFGLNTQPIPYFKRLCNLAQSSTISKEVTHNSTDWARVFVVLFLYVLILSDTLKAHIT